MKNFKHNGKVISHVEAGAIVSGIPVAIGTMVGVAVGSYAAGEEGEYAMSGVFSLVDDGTNHAQGVQVSYDISTGLVVADGDANEDFKMGFVTKTGAAGVVEVMINGLPY